jgi:hypothetical protein
MTAFEAWTSKAKKIGNVAFPPSWDPWIGTREWLKWGIIRAGVLLGLGSQMWSWGYPRLAFLPAI